MVGGNRTKESAEKRSKGNILRPIYSFRSYSVRCFALYEHNVSEGNISIASEQRNLSAGRQKENGDLLFTVQPVVPFEFYCCTFITCLKEYNVKYIEITGSVGKN